MSQINQYHTASSFLSPLHPGIRTAELSSSMTVIVPYFMRISAYVDTCLQIAMKIQRDT